MNNEEHYKYYVGKNLFGFFDNDCMKNELPMDEITEFYKELYDDLEI